MLNVRGDSAAANGARWIRNWARIALAGLAGCVGAWMPPERGSADFVEVTLDRLPCFGTCPVYTVSVNSTGEITFAGVAHVATMGPMRTDTSRTLAADLAAEFERAGFFALADQYVYGQPLCAPYVADMPRTILKVEIGSRTKQVEYDPGCAGAPQLISELAALVDAAVDVRRWTAFQE